MQRVLKLSERLTLQCIVLLSDLRKHSSISRFMSKAERKHCSLVYLSTVGTTVRFPSHNTLKNIDECIPNDSNPCISLIPIQKNQVSYRTDAK